MEKLRQAEGKGDGEELWIQQTLLKETAYDFTVDDKWNKGKEDLNIPILSKITPNTLETKPYWGLDWGSHQSCS